RHCSTIKTYEYHILNRTFRLPQMRNNTFFCHYALDLETMNEAAQYLVGEHDFKSFCSVNTQAETTVRTIYSIEVTGQSLSRDVPDSEDEDGGEKFDLDRGREIVIRVSGNGFLYNMVRIIAGTLIDAGCKRRTPLSVKEALDGCNRELAGPTAPPQGLTLIEIKHVGTKL
ncbi:MAG TPA: tRNA pseudouridine(38-40) synthase TruA, partial [Bacteroides sp.]|nr:tRNA pseudouridine(38-40) synthase TruA [Bacteroides sp.]